jgi:hypothetical protein
MHTLTFRLPSQALGVQSRQWFRYGSLRGHGRSEIVPGVRLELPGKTLIISSQIAEKERRRLIEAFLNSGPNKPAKRATDRRVNSRRH